MEMLSTAGMHFDKNNGTGAGIWGKRSPQQPAPPVETTVKIIKNDLPRETRNQNLEAMRVAADKAAHGQGNQISLEHNTTQTE